MAEMAETQWCWACGLNHKEPRGQACFKEVTAGHIPKNYKYLTDVFDKNAKRAKSAEDVEQCADKAVSELHKEDMFNSKEEYMSYLEAVSIESESSFGPVREAVSSHNHINANIIISENPLDITSMSDDELDALSPQRKKSSVKPQTPTFWPLAAFKPQTPTIKPQASSRPQTPTINPQASSRPQTPTIKPQASSRPQTPTVSPQASSRPQTPTIKPQASSRPQTPTIKPQASSRPETPTINPQASSRAQTPTIKPQASSRPETPTINPQASSRAHTPTIKPQASSRPQSPSTKPQASSRAHTPIEGMSSSISTEEPKGKSKRISSFIEGVSSSLSTSTEEAKVKRGGSYVDGASSTMTKQGSKKDSYVEGASTTVKTKTELKKDSYAEGASSTISTKTPDSKASTVDRGSSPTPTWPSRPVSPLTSDVELEPRSSPSYAGDEGSDRFTPTKKTQKKGLSDEKDEFSKSKTPDSAVKTSDSSLGGKTPDSSGASKTPESLGASKTPDSLGASKTPDSLVGTKTAGSSFTSKTPDSSATVKTPDSKTPDSKLTSPHTDDKIKSDTDIPRKSESKADSEGAKSVLSSTVSVDSKITSSGGDIKSEGSDLTGKMSPASGAETPKKGRKKKKSRANNLVSPPPEPIPGSRPESQADSQIILEQDDGQKMTALSSDESSASGALKADTASVTASVKGKTKKRRSKDVVSPTESIFDSRPESLTESQIKLEQDDGRTKRALSGDESSASGALIIETASVTLSVGGKTPKKSKSKKVVSPPPEPKSDSGSGLTKTVLSSDDESLSRMGELSEDEHQAGDGSQTKSGLSMTPTSPQSTLGQSIRSKTPDSTSKDGSIRPKSKTPQSILKDSGDRSNTPKGAKVKDKRSPTAGSPMKVDLPLDAAGDEKKEKPKEDGAKSADGTKVTKPGVGAKSADGIKVTTPGVGAKSADGIKVTTPGVGAKSADGTKVTTPGAGAKRADGTKVTTPGAGDGRVTAHVSASKGPHVSASKGPHVKLKHHRLAGAVKKMLPAVSSSSANISYSSLPLDLSHESIITKALGCPRVLANFVLVPADTCSNKACAHGNVIDIEKIIMKCAYVNLKVDPPKELTWSERVFSLETVLQLTVEKNCLGVFAREPMRFIPFKPPDLGNEEFPSDAEVRSTVLYSVVKKNPSQNHLSSPCITEQETLSLIELGLRCGMLIAEKVTMDIQLPPEFPQYDNLAPNGKMPWTFTRGQTNITEVPQKWKMDHNLVVFPKSIGELRMSVQEDQFLAEFVQPCKIIPKTEDNMIPVKVKYRGNVIAIVKIACAEVVEMCPDIFRIDPKVPTEILCDMHGIVHLISGTSQEIWCRNSNLNSPSQQSSYTTVQEC